MFLVRAFSAVVDWIDSQPTALRPPLRGAFAIAFLSSPAVIARCLRIGVASSLGNGQRTGPLLATLFGGLAIAMLGGAFSGAVYPVAGRWARPIPVVGPYLAGVLTVVPYAAVIVLLIRAMNEVPFSVPPDGGEIVAFALCSLFAGAIVGQAAFTPEGLT